MKQATNRKTKRFLSLFLAVAVLVMSLPVVIFAAPGSADSYVADISTYDYWKNLFGKDHLSTENAGSVWMDKSVFNDEDAFEDVGVDFVPNGENFLVALSTIASNSSVTGVSSAPIDTIFVLDFSGSMNQGFSGNKLSDEMIEATNESIDALLKASPLHRVAVIAYSGSSSSSTSNDAATVFLPLGRYTTRSGAYLDHSRNGNGSVSINANVRIEGTSTKPTEVTKNVSGATYIQKGIYSAMQQFTASGNSVTATNTQGETLDRIPAIVLMTDGDPSLGTTNFSNPGQYNLGTGSGTSSALGFVTQLTISYVKECINQKYNEDCLLYTLGLGVDSGYGNEPSVAESVLNPENCSTTIDEMWENYEKASVGSSVSVNRQNSVTKISTPLKKNYVDGYYSVTGSESDLAAGLKDAFAGIVSNIVLKGSYFPTLVQGTEELSGYVSFVDRVGEYMKVSDFKGIMINNVLHSGSSLAQNLTSTTTAGTVVSPTELGMEMIASIQARLKIESYDEVVALVRLAYEHGQLYYNSEDDFSNYIGWYANAAGDFLGFWYEGMTTLPEATGNPATDPAYVVKSYGFLGDTDPAHGVSRTDLMYATVRVRRSLATGEEVVTFAVPAALIPTVTYGITLDDNGDPDEMTVTGADHPIALLYEVELREDINRFNLTEKVDADYLSTHRNADGSVNFYASEFDLSNQTGYGTRNTYGYFYPSRQNERYYYQSSSQVFSDSQGTLYTGNAKPTASGTFYRSYTYYKMEGSSLSRVTAYVPLAEAAYATLERGANNSWMIPEGNVRVDLSRYSRIKLENSTGTFSLSNDPFVDYEGHGLHDVNHNYVVGYTLGNNGRVTLTPETGLKLTKTVTEAVDGASEEFLFNVTSSQPLNGQVPAMLVRADGTVAEGVVIFVSSSARLALKDGEALYLGGLTDGVTYTVTEEVNVAYSVSDISGNGIRSGNSFAVLAQAGQVKNVNYTNAPKLKGDLVVSKFITHSYGSAFTADVNRDFAVRVTLTGFGVADKTFRAEHSGNLSLTSVATNENGVFEISLKHGEQFEVFGLPEGTVALVEELNVPAGYTVQYREDGLVGGDGRVTVAPERAVSVSIYNDYEAQAVSFAGISVDGIKNLDDTTGTRGWLATDEFSFRLQRFDPATDSWITLGTDATVLGSASEKIFTFDHAFDAETFDQIGVYLYRVIEIVPQEGIPGISYDRTVHSFSVEVADDDWDAKLEIKNVVGERGSVQIQKAGEEWHVSVAFTNTYSNAGSRDDVYVELQKILTNSSNSALVGLSGYTFGLYSDAACTNLVATSEATNSRGFSRLILTFDAQGDYTYYLKEIVPANPIPGMNYSSEVVRVNVRVSDDTVGGLSAVVWKGDSANPPANASELAGAEFVNVYLPTATTFVPVVKKTMTGRALLAEEFTFVVAAEGSTVPLITGKNDSQGNVIWDGSISLSQVGEYRFDVFEVAGNAGGVRYDSTVYRVLVTVTDQNGVLQADYVVLNTLSNQVEFVNVYTPTPIRVTVDGVKELSGRNLLNEEFTFVLEEVDANASVLPQGIRLTATNTMAKTFAFNPFTYTQAGVYSYRIREIAGNSDNGVQYDSTEFLVTVTVTDDGNGTLSATKQIAVIGGGEVSSVTFVNRYVPRPVQHVIPGNKYLNGAVLIEGAFTFELYEADSQWNAGASPVDTATNGSAAEEGVFSFDAITFDRAGTFYYVIKEQNGGNVSQGVTYDDTVYYVTITVTDNHQGDLFVSRLIRTAQGLPVDRAEFYNEYRATGEETVLLEGKKEVTGDAYTLTAGAFSFELYQTDSTFNTDNLSALQTVTNRADGTFSFDAVSLDALGTYYFVVMERGAGQTLNGMTYDATRYHITVEIRDNGVGGFQKVFTMTKNGVNATEILFSNSYHTADTTLVPDVDKILTGRPLRDGEFSFEILPENGTTPVLTGTNNAQGEVIWNGVLPFTAAGEYRYRIAETVGSVAGVQYDATVYEILVTVVDHNGALAATYTVVGQNTNEIVFRNQYAPAPLDVDIRGNKVLTGRDLFAEEFTFVLEECDSAGNVLAGGIRKEAKNDANGRVIFPFDTYTEATTRYFLVRELAGNAQNGITYDSTAYFVTVLVTDDGNATLSATTEIRFLGSTEILSEITFRNHYAPAEVQHQIRGEKVLEGAELQKDQFSFELYEADENWNLGAAPIDVQKNGTKAENGAFAFAAITYTTHGVYRYAVKEVSGGSTQNGITYDDTVYLVTVMVTDNGLGTLTVTETVREENASANGVIFRNVYRITGTVDYELNGTKTVTGDPYVLQKDEFIFELYETDATFGILQGSNPVATGTNAADGTFSFAKLTYSEIGTYRYVLVEKDGGTKKDGILYDDAKFEITVLVEDNGIGGLKKTVTVQESGANVSEIVFENHYERVIAPPTGDTTDLMLWVALAFVSGFGFLALTVGERKHRNATR